MDITETEFFELLMESGNCQSGKFDKRQKFSVKFIQSIDPEKWILD